MNINFDDIDQMLNGTMVQSQQEAVSAVPKKNDMQIVVGNVKLMDAIKKMTSIRDELNEQFQEREELISNMLLAITVGVNMVMLGPPGTGKTAITEELCSRIENANYFSWMLNKTSDPSEILGSFSIKEMENDKFKRVTDLKLPQAHIAFIDEVYKSNSPTLNALLTIMNEHYFYNDGKKEQVPLISMFGASNESPEDDSLAALHDRFIFRMNVNYIHDSSNKKKMFNNYLNRLSGNKANSKTIITIDEIKTLQKSAKGIKVPKSIMNEFIKLISRLEKEDIHVSDRRQNECFKIMQGSALLRQANNVDVDDFRPLVDILWEKEDQIPFIEEIVIKMVNPYEDRYRELKEAFDEIVSQVESTSTDQERQMKAVEVNPQINKLVGKINKLISEAVNSGKNIDKFIKLKEEAVNYGAKEIEKALSSASI